MPKEKKQRAIRMTSCMTRKWQVDVAQSTDNAVIIINMIILNRFIILNPD
jgi:hypothetical protein